jgi:ABC-type dipeptide/oligopeptide/nickel transport system ATPase component
MRDLAIAAGSALLFISHDLAVVRTIADRVAVALVGGLSGSCGAVLGVLLARRLR